MTDATRAAAEHMLDAALSDLAASHDAIVSEIEHVIATAAPRTLRRHLLRRMRPVGYYRTAPVDGRRPVK